MEKNIASHDLSDMMVYEGMYAQSRKFHFKQKFVFVQKAVEKVIGWFERGGKYAKGIVSAPQRSVYPKEVHFSSTASAFYAISLASVLISFFWLTLYFSA